MSRGYFKKAVIFSLCGHFTALGLFGFSFGARLAPPAQTDILSYGAILGSRDLKEKEVRPGLKHAVSGLHSSEPLPEGNIRGSAAPLGVGYLKPRLAISGAAAKPVFVPSSAKAYLAEKKGEPAVMLYPQLPYGFLLYFRDRQIVPIELEFSIASGEDEGSHILIKRKVSSGSLEADLLAMRTIKHYLFIQQGRFSRNKWQAVKIELSAKDGK